MANKTMPHHYWAKAVATAIYIMNRTPTIAVHGMTLEEKYSGRKLDLSHLKAFGALHMYMYQMSYGLSWIRRLKNMFSLGTHLSRKGTNVITLSHVK